MKLWAQPQKYMHRKVRAELDIVVEKHLYLLVVVLLMVLKEQFIG